MQLRKAKDIGSMSFDGLMGKLKAFEVQMRIEDEEENPQKAIVEAKVPEQKKVIKEEKNLAFKSSKSGKEARSSKGLGCVK